MKIWIYSKLCNHNWRINYFFLHQNLEYLQLLNQNSTNKHKKKINYIHIGLVQVAIKPLFHLGLDILMFVCLRNVRATKFFYHVLSMIDTNLANSCVYFNCLPNFSMI